MKYSICQNTYCGLKKLFEESKPRLRFAEVTQDLVEGFILSKLVWTRNFFERLKKAGGATHEIKARARDNLGRRSTRSIRKEVTKLMGQRICQINKEVRTQKHKCTTSSTKVE